MFIDVRLPVRVGAFFVKKMLKYLVIWSKNVTFVLLLITQVL